MGLILGIGLSWLQAWQMSQHKPLTHLQDATGTFAWRYVDLQAPYDNVFDECTSMVQATCIDKSVAFDRNKGILVGYTHPTRWAWPMEINLRVEPVTETATRVQILSRPMMGLAIAGLGANRRLADNAVGALKALHPALAEG
ncbi:MAG: hypothetical protein IVW55_12165 [Chloroflexi bacterium]|nr:hypothetical protein [Chloroflexota bacterium]